MKLGMLGLLGMGLLVAAEPAAKESPRKEDTAELQGQWAPTRARGYGKEFTKDEVSNLRLTIHGHRLTATYNDKKVEATLKLNAATSPRTIDVTITEGPADIRGKTFLGLYLLEGNRLHIAFRNPGEPRPAEFVKEGQKDVYEVDFKHVQS